MGIEWNRIVGDELNPASAPALPEVGMRDDRGPLPEYEHPPVMEVVLGIRFSLARKLEAAHIGAFWGLLPPEFQRVETLPSLPPVVERFTEEPQPASVSFELNCPRTHFIDASDNWVIQLQQDRLLVNWRKMRDSDVYPRFPAVLDRFRETWERFREFCGAKDRGAMTLEQFEVTYINHLPSGVAWSNLGEIGEVFPALRWVSSHAFLPIPESLACRLSFLMPDGMGRLHVELAHARRRDNSRPVLLCDLTARGLPSECSEGKAIEDWFLLGREWIVRGFADLMSDSVQRNIWGRNA